MQKHCVKLPGNIGSRAGIFNGPLQALFRERQAKLNLFKERSETLSSAAALLEEGISAAQAQARYPQPGSHYSSKEGFPRMTLTFMQ